MSDWKPNPQYKASHERIVSAANRHHVLTEVIVPSARHLDPMMRDLIKRLGFTGNEFAHPEDQGFINQWGQFLSREEAWVVAEKQGQIIRHIGCDGTLYSENLY